MRVMADFDWYLSLKKKSVGNFELIYNHSFASLWWQRENCPPRLHDTKCHSFNKILPHLKIVIMLGKMYINLFFYFLPLSLCLVYLYITFFQKNASLKRYTPTSKTYPCFRTEFYRRKFTSIPLGAQTVKLTLVQLMQKDLFYAN